MLKKLILLAGLIAILVNHNAYTADQKAPETPDLIDPRDMNPFFINGRLAFIRIAKTMTPAEQRRHGEPRTDEQLAKEYQALLRDKTRMLECWLNDAKTPEDKDGIRKLLDKHLALIKNESADQ